jgi:hypothetical protein
VKRTVLVVVVGLAACSSANHPDVVADAQPDAATVPDADGDARPPDGSKVYCHSGKELYRLDTRTIATIDIGPFGAALGGAGITDIAVNKDDEMVGVSLDAIWRIDVAHGTATKLKALKAGAPNLTSLSFVPVDLDDPDSAELLVAADGDGNVLRIDPDTGDFKKVGAYGKSGSKPIVSSGDIVAVRGAGIYATVNVGTKLGDDDYLAKIDPVTWKATVIGGDLGRDKVFGLAYWGGTLYGFIDEDAAGGSIIAIDPKTAKVTPVASGLTEWFGAGVTTDAPLVF